jgi:hypothetical protein
MNYSAQIEGSRWGEVTHAGHLADLHGQSFWYHVDERINREPYRIIL